MRTTEGEKETLTNILRMDFQAEMVSLLVKKTSEKVSLPDKKKHLKKNHKTVEIKEPQ